MSTLYLAKRSALLASHKGTTAADTGLAVTLSHRLGSTLDNGGVRLFLADAREPEDIATTHGELWLSRDEALTLAHTLIRAVTK